MNIRKFTSKDIPVVAEWYKDLSWPFPAVPDAFPQCGFVAESGSELLACAFLYTTGTSVSYLDWTAYSPTVTPALGIKALKAIITKIQDEVMPIANPPIRILNSYSANEKFQDVLKALGFRFRNEVKQFTWISK